MTRTEFETTNDKSKVLSSPLLILKKSNLAILTAAQCLVLGLSSVSCSGDKKSDDSGMRELSGNIGQSPATGKMLTVPSQEALPRRIQTSPPPVYRNSKEVLDSLEGKELLRGDKVIATRLALAVQSHRQATFKLTMDYPYADGAAMSVSQEATTWIQTKMAEFGYASGPGKPDLMWIVHVQPGEEEGSYGLDTALWSEGIKLFHEMFVVPVQFSSDRMTQVFSRSFTPKAP